MTQGNSYPPAGVKLRPSLRDILADAIPGLKDRDPRIKFEPVSAPPASSWQALIRPLLADYPWLGPFDEPLEARLATIAGDTRATRKRQLAALDALDLDGNLQEAVKAIDRCLAYRREYNDLAATAVRQALEYQLFDEQRDSLRELEIAEWIQILAHEEAIGNAEVASRFDAIDDSLAPGFSSVARLNEKLASLKETTESGKYQDISDKWNALTRYQKGLKSRHTTPGHAMNFGERAQRVLSLLTYDFENALSSLSAFEIGFRYAHDLELVDLYTPESESVLDEFVRKIQVALRQYASKRRNEVKREVLLANLDIPDGPDSPIKVELSVAHPGRLVALAICIKIAEQKERHRPDQWRAKGRLNLPDTGLGLATRQSTSIYFDNAPCTFSEGQLAYFAFDRVANIKCAGSWGLEIASMYHSDPSTKTPLSLVRGAIIHAIVWEPVAV